MLSMLGWGASRADDAANDKGSAGKRRMRDDESGSPGDGEDVLGSHADTEEEAEKEAKKKRAANTEKAEDKKAKGSERRKGGGGQNWTTEEVTYMLSAGCTGGCARALSAGHQKFSSSFASSL